jgi:predicted amino acid dehydrogenase
MSRGGLDVVDALPLRVATGRLYTVINITQLVLQATQRVELKVSDVRVGIVGAAGSIGAGVAQLLAHEGVQHFTLVDLSDKDKDLREVTESIRHHVPCATIRGGSDTTLLRTADVVVTATNRPDALITADVLRLGAIVVDDAQPSDVEKSLFLDDRFVVLEGGVVHSGNISVPFAMGLQNPHDIFSCMAELLILMSDDMPVQSPIGRSLKLDFRAIDVLVAHGKRLGFRLGTFQNDLRSYTDSDFVRIRNVRKETP